MRAAMRVSAKITGWLCCALLLRALVPVGYMLLAPSSAAAQGLELAFCPTQNPGVNVALIAPLDSSGGHQHHAQHDHSDHANSNAISIDGSCSLWLASSADQALVAAVTALSVDFSADTNQSRPTLPTRALAPRPFQARAPPALVIC